MTLSDGTSWSSITRTAAPLFSSSLKARSRSAADVKRMMTREEAFVLQASFTASSNLAVTLVEVWAAAGAATNAANTAASTERPQTAFFRVVVSMSGRRIRAFLEQV